MVLQLPRLLLEGAMVGMWNAVWLCKCGRSLRTMLGNRAFLCSVLESFEGA